ncbi:hypothetical protein [Streptomyces sp. Wh19]|uniref:hypothetical protein n=1 Tax=Streptomyces sp. Wh19 TaxID=3076629 RepID=UPI003FA34535
MTEAGDPNLRHLLARAVAVEQRIRRAVEARQLTDPDPDDAFRGLYLTDENIARLLDENEARAFPYPVPDPIPDAAPEPEPEPEPGPTAEAHGAPGASAPAPAHGGAPVVTDELVRALYAPLSRLFKADLRLERERAGFLINTRH